MRRANAYTDLDTIEIPSNDFRISPYRIQISCSDKQRSVQTTPDTPKTTCKINMRHTSIATREGRTLCNSFNCLPYIPTHITSDIHPGHPYLERLHLLLKVLRTINGESACVLCPLLSDNMATSYHNGRRLPCNLRRQPSTIEYASSALHASATT
jgi:hypothetical protein